MEGGAISKCLDPANGGTPKWSQDFDYDIWGSLYDIVVDGSVHCAESFSTA